MRRLVNVLDAAEHRIATVFNTIKTAAMLIEVIEPQAILDSWNRQESTMPFLDPTAYQKVLAAREDMRRKRRLVEAAAKFLAEWNAVKAEALAAAEAEAPTEAD